MAARYQAMLATAFDYARGDAASRVAAWRQIVDIVAQAGTALDEATRARAFAMLAALARDIPLRQRRLASASLAGRVTDAGLVAVFAHDAPAVAAPMLAQLAVTDTQWVAMIPALPAASRNILRNRRDLSATAGAALARFAAADLALPPSAAGAAAVDVPRPVGTTPILDLVERIARFREREPATNGRSLAGEPDAAPSFFAFETDGEGTIAWVEGAPRIAIIGISLAYAAEPGAAGVDAAAAGAWRRRSPLGPCRLLIAGGTVASGDWTIEAVPLFDPRSGRFVGYRGEARRPSVGDRAAGVPVAAGGGEAGDAGSDTIRQLVHELRTPLNAIQGFAAMIDGQMLGPAASAHRVHAQGIVTEVGRLVALIDDLDLAARLDAGAAYSRTAASALPSLRVSTVRVVAAQRSALAARGVAVRFEQPDEFVEDTTDGPVVPLEDVLDRIVARLFAAILATAAPGEVVAVSVETRFTTEMLRVVRPVALRGVATAKLLDADTDLGGASPDAPMLGLGFSLRLCARLAVEQGGRLTIAPDAFELALPAAAARDDYIAR